MITAASNSNDFNFQLNNFDYDFPAFLQTAKVAQPNYRSGVLKFYSYYLGRLCQNRTLRQSRRQPPSRFLA